MRMGPVSFLALSLLTPVTLCAQGQASLGIGTGIVRYAGGSSFSALTVSPAAQWLTPTTYLGASAAGSLRSEEHTSELQSHSDLVCRLLLEKKKKTNQHQQPIFKINEQLDDPRHEVLGGLLT